MVVCKFFLQGTCRFGSNCKFEHQVDNDRVYGNANSVLLQNYANKPVQNTSNVDTNTLVKSVVNDMTSAEKGGQWLLSTYAPFREKPAFPGFEDNSMEEIRFQFYEAVKNGTVEQFKQNLQLMLQQAAVKVKALQNPSPDIINMLKNIYHTTPSPNAGVFGNNQSPFNGGSTQSNSIFNNNQQQTKSVFSGNAPSNQNVFGNKTGTFGQQSVFASTENNSAFGGTSQSGNTSVFSGTVQNKPPSIFGGTPQSGGTSIFGGTSQSGTTSVFGGTPQSGTTSVFGGTPQSGTTSVFGGTPQSETPSVFGGPHHSGNNSVFSRSPQSGTPSVQNAHPQTSNSSVFNNNSVFGQQQSQSAFVGTNQQTSPFSHINQQKSVFGQIQTPAQNIFQQNSSPTFATQNQQITTSLSTEASQLPPQHKSILGNLIEPPQSSMFRAKDDTYDEDLYSKLEELTEDEIKWFESDDLDIENIPEKPPTYKMCSIKS